MTSIAQVVDPQLSLVFLSGEANVLLKKKKKSGLYFFKRKLCRLWNIIKYFTECLCRTYGNRKAAMYHMKLQSEPTGGDT